jgi:hypothetical protein
MAIAAGWYNDPEYPSQLRWWSGTEWTAHRAPAPVSTLPAYPSQTAAVEQFVPPRAEPALKPRRSRGWLWIVAGVAVAVLIVGTTFATGHLTFGTATLASKSGNGTSAGSGATVTTPQLSSLATFGNPAAPAGMTSGSGATVVIPEATTAGQELQNESQVSKVALSIPACAALMYDSPITSTDVGSTDPLNVFANYRSTDGTSSLDVQGAVRQYSSAAAASKSFEAMSTINQKCAGGYSNPDGQVKMEGESDNWTGTTTVAWTQILPGNNGTSIKLSTFNMLRGNLMVRGICAYGGTETSTLAGQCLNWMSTLHDSIVRAAS